MSNQQQNPLRNIAQAGQSVAGGTSNLVANGIYGVEDIVNPVLMRTNDSADPRLFYSQGGQRSPLSWRKVGSDGWISPKQKAADDKDTILQIKYSKPKKLNFLMFSLLRVPQLWEVKYYDSVRKRMVTLSDENGQKVSGTLVGSAVNSLGTNDDSGSRKWRDYSFDLPTIRTSLIEIHMNRDVSITSPDNLVIFPRNIPYSLGVRNLNIKFKLHDDDGDDDDGDGTPTPIGTTERPVITRYTSILAHDTDSESYWECGPQGAASSVVPYYLDLRDTDGSATVFDMLKLIPLWSGPSMSLYFSSDDVTTPWQLSPNHISMDSVGAGASFTQDIGLSFTASSSRYFVSNDYLRADLTSSFSVGLLWTPTDTNTGGVRWLWNFSKSGYSIGLRFTPTANSTTTMTGRFEIVKVVGGVETVLFSGGSIILSKGNQQGVAIGYDTSTQTWTASTATMPTSSTQITVDLGTTNTSFSGFFPEEFSLGSNAALDAAALGTIMKAWVRLDPLYTEVANAFFTNPQSFVLGEGDRSQRVNGHYNAIFIARLSKDTLARVGPGAGFFRNKTWTPIPVDYTLSTNNYKIPITEAKYLKLEFSNLVPRTYLTEEPTLPVTDFPSSVKDWYRSTWRRGQTSNSVNSGREMFEAVPSVQTPGDPRRYPEIRTALDGRSNTTLPSTIYHSDQSSADFAVNPKQFDGSLRYTELEFATTPMRFYRKGRHEYDTTFISVEHRAFFVGIKDLQVFRTDHSLQFDSPEYHENYIDQFNLAGVLDIRDVEPNLANIDLPTRFPGGTDKYTTQPYAVPTNQQPTQSFTSLDFIDTGGGLSAQSAGASILSKTLSSFSKFETIQMAALSSGWQSEMTNAQIDLGTITHLISPEQTNIDLSTSTSYSIVTGQYQGARGGNVLRLQRLSGGSGNYGVRTTTGLFTGVISGAASTSAVVRLQLPDTNKGTYLLNLYAKNSGNYRLVASKPIVIPVKSWQEVEIAYTSSAGDSDWEAEVVQTNPSISEALVVDMLGIWRNPVRWEVSNDDGATWQTVVWPMNKPNGYIRFSQADYRLKVRATALKVGAVISGWTVIPWYLESSMVIRAPIDYNPPWGVSDSEDLRATEHKPMFQRWNHFFPQNFSINLRGLY